MIISGYLQYYRFIIFTLFSIARNSKYMWLTFSEKKIEGNAMYMTYLNHLGFISIIKISRKNTKYSHKFRKYTPNFREVTRNFRK